MLRVSRLSKRFGGLRAVDDASLGVAEGRIVALIGPNGAGKTTLFAMISGFLRPDAGTVVFQRTDITGMARHRICELGLVRTFQLVQPFVGLTVRENIAIGVHVRVARRRDALAKAADVAERVHLTRGLDEPADRLTAADRKRLELARALATQPKLLLLDEVMAGLTPTETEEVVQIIRGIRDSGVTVLLIEHVMQAVMRLAEHTYVLSDGRIIAEGRPMEMAAHPRVIEAYLGHGAAARMAGFATAGPGDGQ